MKKTKTLLLALLCTVLYALPAVAADVAKTVELTEAGTLSTVLTDDEKSTITHLTITGEINKLDFDVMKSDMENLTYIDLSGSTIAYYSSTYPANTIPNSALGASGWYSTEANTKISTFIFPSEVTSIGSFAFGYCTGLTGSLIIPEGVASIGTYAFNGCSGFTGSLTIPEGVTKIGTYAFNGCSGFTGSLTIPEGVTTIVTHAFYGCSGFTGSLTIPEGVTDIENNAFNGCSGFTGSLTIPEGVTYIGFSAFNGCSGFTGSLTIPEGVTDIEDNAFYGCSDFTGSLTIPEGVTYIGSYAFYSCKGFAGTLTIPKGVTWIEDSAFDYCSGLTSLIFEDGVTTVSDAFYGCTGITTVTSYSETPPTCESGYFSSIDKDKCTLEVPTSSIEDYSAATEWSTFVNIMGIDVPTTVYLAQLYVGSNGTVTANGTNCGSGETSIEVTEGANFTFTATPNENYAVASVLLNGVDIADQLVDNQYTLTDVQESFTLVVTFEKIPAVYQANITVGSNGTVTANGTSYSDGETAIEVTEGDDFTFTVTPNENYAVASVVLDGVDITDQLVDNQYTLTDVQEGFALVVTFEKLPTYLTLSVWEQGAIWLEMVEGSTLTLRIVASEGWEINSVSYNGVDVTNELDEDDFYTTPAIANGDALVVTYVESTTTSVATKSVTPDIKVYASASNQITVVGAESGEQIAVYTVSGSAVAQRVACSDTEQVTVTNGAVYIVRVGGYTFKLAL